MVRARVHAEVTGHPRLHHRNHRIVIIVRPAYLRVPRIFCPLPFSPSPPTFRFMASPTEAERALPLIDQHPDTDSFRGDVLDGLTQDRKSIPSKYLYDQRGSELFDAICEMDTYYLTRTEMAIMRRHIDEMAAAVGPNVRLVEYGSGSSLKTRILLEALDDVAAYVPLDISRDHLVAAANDLASDYPHIPVQPVCADYTTAFELPDPPPAAERTVVYYPGSTIGNFVPER